MNIEAIITEAKRIAKDNIHGYDQTNRQGPDYDCSSFVAHCLNAGGFNFPTWTYTGNIRKLCSERGFITYKWEENLPLKTGDIVLKENKHVILVTDGSSLEIANCSSNENGKAKGGKTGDQNGKEIYIGDFYIYKDGWDYVLRFDYDFSNSVKKVHPAITEVAKEVIKGKFGNYDERRRMLKESGFYYDVVQDEVNRILKGG